MRAFWTTADLLAQGRTDRQIAAAVAKGRLRLVRRGLYCRPSTTAQLVRAARVGGIATASTATAALGLWTAPDLPPGRPYRFPHSPDQDRLHVAFRRTTSRLHDPDTPGLPLVVRTDVVPHRTDAVVVERSFGIGVAPVLLALEHAFRVLPVEHALAAADSALRHRFIRRAELAALEAALPARLRPIVTAADGRADSGIETITCYRLRLAGLHLVVHPTIEGVGEVDLLVEGRLIIELDGRQFHDDEEAFFRDRSRDLAAARARYRVLRFTWRQVLFEWDAVEAAVFAALAY